MCTSTKNMPHGSDDGDDVWADSSDDGRDRRELDREAAARHQHFYNAGYRGGVEEGKESTLQQGFNLGFKEGAGAGFRWGLLRGAVMTLAALDGQTAGTRNKHPQIVALRAAADVAPRNAMLATFRQILNSPMSKPEEHLQTRAQPPVASDAACPQPDGGAASVSGVDRRRADGAARQGGCKDGWLPGGGASGTAGLDLAEAFRALATPSAAQDTDLPASGSEGGGGEARVTGEAPSTTSSGGPSGSTSSGAYAEVAQGGAKTAGSPVRTPSGRSGAVPSLPSDAIALDLPDMLRIQRDLRTGLEQLGFAAVFS